MYTTGLNAVARREIAQRVGRKGQRSRSRIAEFISKAALLSSRAAFDFALRTWSMENERVVDKLRSSEPF
jgi:hypothetical protein